MVILKNKKIKRLSKKQLIKLVKQEIKEWQIILNKLTKLSCDKCKEKKRFLAKFQMAGIYVKIVRLKD